MTDRASRRGFLAAAALTSLAGCLGGRDSPLGGRENDDPPQSSGSPPPLAESSLPLPMPGDQLRQESRSGGPPKDGIPSIDEPTFVDAGDDDRLEPGDIVFGLVRDDEAKAYPQNILVQHEIVNDIIAGDPISVTYCPLTGTVQGFDRGDTTLGVSGRLFNNNLIKYDHPPENWWPQVLATAIPGPWNSSLAGRTLQEFRVLWTTWVRWTAAHPDTAVLSTDTGVARNYQRDPYGQYNPAGGYYTNDSTLFPRLNPNDRVPAKHLVMGVRAPAGAAAVSKDVLHQEGLVEGAIDGTPLLWAYDDAIDTAFAYWNPDETAFTYTDGLVSGPDGDHEPNAVPLDRAVTFDAMWFAWSGLYPTGSVHD